MKEVYCQSCGMPMGKTDEWYGTEKDGTKNKDYCKYCYDKGAFSNDCTMEEMIQFCIPHMATADSGISEAQAQQMMQDEFPTLKRWK